MSDSDGLIPFVNHLIWRVYDGDTRNPGMYGILRHTISNTPCSGVFNYVILHPGAGGWLKYRTPIVFVIRFVVQEVRISEDSYAGSLFAANGFARSLLAAASILFSTPMFNAV